jgi:hypothetical protein
MEIKCIEIDDIDRARGERRAVPPISFSSRSQCVCHYRLTPLLLLSIYAIFFFLLHELTPKEEEKRTQGKRKKKKGKAGI